MNMDLEKLLKLIFENPNNIDIKYTNVNGEESLVVNGEEMLTSNEFDDRITKELVYQYKYYIELLDDCTFNDVIESTDIDIKRFNDLLNKESFSEEESDEVIAMIKDMNKLTKKVLSEKIDYYKGIYDRLF